MSKKVQWWVPRMGTKETIFINRAIKADFINDGPLTAEFEQRIASLLRVEYAVAVTSGTAALFLSLKGLGIGAGDEVIVPDITFIATANAVEMCGAKVVLVDIDSQELTMSIDAFRRAITKKTKAVIPVHVSGRPADMDGLNSIAQKNGIVVIEDAAEALASQYKGHYLGTLGKAGCFSFSPNKTITTGQGGMIVTSDRRLYGRLRELKDQGRLVRGTGGDDLHNSIGYNFKFTDLQAAVGLGQLTYMQSRIKRMRRNYQLYVENLQGIQGITVFDVNIQKGEVPQWVDVVAEERDSLVDYLKRKDIYCRKYWFPLHTQIPYKRQDKSFPQSIRLSRKLLWLPSAFTLSDNDVVKVSNQIKNFYLRRRAYYKENGGEHYAKIDYLDARP